MNLSSKRFVHSQYRSRPAPPTHADCQAVQARRSGASSRVPATDFHQPSALCTAIHRLLLPIMANNCKKSYHQVRVVSTSGQIAVLPLGASSGIMVLCSSAKFVDEADSWGRVGSTGVVSDGLQAEVAAALAKNSGEQVTGEREFALAA